MTVPMTDSSSMELEDMQLTEDTIETCDRCGPAVRAVWLVSTGEGPLTFCGAHYRRFRDARKERNAAST